MTINVLDTHKVTIGKSENKLPTGTCKSSDLLASRTSASFSKKYIKVQSWYEVGSSCLGYKLQDGRTAEADKMFFSTAFRSAQEPVQPRRRDTILSKTCLMIKTVFPDAKHSTTVYDRTGDQTQHTVGCPGPVHTASQSSNPPRPADTDLQHTTLGLTALEPRQTRHWRPAWWKALLVPSKGSPGSRRAETHFAIRLRQR